MRRKISFVRLGRCVAFLAATAFLLPFTILVLVADQQFNLSYSSRRVFYQESDFYKINGTLNVPTSTTSSNSLRPQFMLENSTREGFLSRERLLEVGARMDARREYMEAQCSKLSLDSSKHRTYTWEYLINTQYHVVWCNIFKAASTSWMYNFNLMANYSASFLEKTQEVPLALARKRYVRPTVEMVRNAQKDSITFLIVRHPLERLASAYKDKIVFAWKKSYHDKMGKRIVKKYRKVQPIHPTEYPLFEEFVAYLLDEKKAKRSLDMHWTPYTSFCTPCKIHFDVIMKFETLDEDQRFLIQVAKLQDVVKPEKKNVGKGINTLTKINNYYSRITRAQLDGLYDLYKYDFQIFNYTIEPYYDLVKNE